MLAIAAEHDRATPVAAARRIAATAPRGELLVIAGAGHFPFAEAPGLLGRIGRSATRLTARATDLSRDAGERHAALGRP